jgi:hypothetical protein
MNLRVDVLLKLVVKHFWQHLFEANVFEIQLVIQTKQNKKGQHLLLLDTLTTLRDGLPNVLFL